MKLFCQYWKPESTVVAAAAETKIVLLHGLGGTGALWRPIGSALEDDCEILAPDQRGHGASRGSEIGSSYTPLDYGCDVIETLQSLKFHPAWLVGHSMGVRTACAAAHLRSDWVRGLVLVDLGFGGQAGGRLGLELARFLAVLPEEFADRRTAREFMARECPDPAIAQYLLAVASVGASPSPGARTGPLTFPFDKSALVRTIEAAESTGAGSSVRDWAQELASRGMPILALRGAESLVWSQGDFVAERERFKGFPNVTFEEVANAGHGLPFEQRAFFVRRLREFVGIKPETRPA